MAGIEAKKITKGLAINRRKGFVLKIPHYLFTDYGKLVNGSAFDMNWTAQHFNQNISDKQRDFSGGELKALISISELTAEVITNYSKQQNRDVLQKLVQSIEDAIGSDRMERVIDDYCSDFLKIKRSAKRRSDKAFLVQDILLNWLNNINSAFRPYKAIFDNSGFLGKTDAVFFVQEMVSFLDSDDNNTDSKIPILSLYRILREPAEKFPDSIFDQLEFISEYWREYLDDTTELLKVIDILREEQVRFGGVPGAMPVIDYKNVSIYEDEEYYSLDKDWMPSLILIAKSTYVWLSQLSMKYSRMIRRLDEIPSEELKIYADRGITGIWLIGIWQRSYASEKIKRMNGYQNVIASAYSLDSYRIADDLGGQKAWDVLSEKAGKYGLRMGCDMVPNHTGIDSNWIVHHPDWFIQRSDLPYPGYSFTGENLSSHPQVEVRIEDHYYAKTDAAVVFEMRDRRDGSTRYIYHGNDGTGLPWNDTAQLNYVLKEVREAVINEIISIAKRIPIIRFDAAMTLAKKHYQRLWYPKPGSGGDIPTRSQYSMSKEEFDRVFPREFWRDVVDRVNEEAHDTLLLAEAFWMMEGYFVRNLGMHRVYNSAFMHMLMREDNSAFRKTIYNTIEFDKRILKRYVNFMSNPDEDTAIAQFGDDNKYFGVCVLMCTLPGLPMFGHGQIEGFHEKYGMEFAAPQTDEKENRYLVERHEREIFPLLKHRMMFAEADAFRLFDFYNGLGDLNENVIAYSNSYEGKDSLVIYNNSYDQTHGRLKTAIDFSINATGVKTVENIDLSVILGLKYKPQTYLIFKDMISGKEFLRHCDSFINEGMEIDLNGYEYRVFTDFKVLEDDAENRLQSISESIGLSGTDSIEKMRKLLTLRPMHMKLQALFTSGMIKNQDMLVSGELKNAEERKFFLEKELFPAIHDFHYSFMEIAGFTEWTDEKLRSNTLNFFKHAKKAIIRNKPQSGITPPGCIVSIWTLLREIRKRTEENKMDFYHTLDKFLIKEPVLEIFAERCGMYDPSQCFDLACFCLEHEDFWKKIIDARRSEAVKELLEMNEIRHMIRLNEYKGQRWVHKESFELVMSTMEIILRIKRCEDKRYRILIELKEIGRFFLEMINNAKESGYNYDLLLRSDEHTNISNEEA